MNILWITCDELRASAVPGFGKSVLPYRLPGFERLAAEGTRFSQCHVQVPKCIPMRGQFLTGRYPHADGLRTMSRAHFSGDHFMLLRKDSPSLLRWLKDAGYAVGLTGKNHVLRFSEADELFDPIPAGPEKGQPVSCEGSKSEWTRAYFAGRVCDDYDRETFADTRHAEGIIRFIEAHADRPFFALCDIGEPHPPYKEWPEYADDIPLGEVPLPPRPEMGGASPVIQALRRAHDNEALPDEDRRRILRAYWSQTRFADSLVQRILDALDRLRLADNTLVILGSDHGDFAGHYGCFEKWDTALYDCITHVPLVMRLPGKLPGGTDVTGLVEGIDIAPTILELLGMKIPDTIHGQSLLPLADGRESASKKVVFSQGGLEPSATLRPGRDYQDRIPPFYYGKQETLIQCPEALQRAHMVRSKTHKLIYRLDGRHELYDLQADPEELHNRYGETASTAIVSDLEKRLLEFFVRYQVDTPAIRELWA